MKKKPKIRRYACLNRMRKKKQERQIRWFQRLTKKIRDDSSYGFFGKDLSKIKWPTLEETLNKMHQKYTHKEYEDLFLCHIQPREDNLNYDLAKSERDLMDRQADDFFKSLKKSGELE